MDAQQFNSTMQSLAYGEAMLAAAKDYKEEVLNEENAAGPGYDPLDVDDYLDDPELERLHAERLSQLKEEGEKRAKERSLKEKGHGTYREIDEGEFLEVVTKTERVVCHFFQGSFERCKIMDKHMNQLCEKYFGTRFIKLCAQDAPFFATKLDIQVLPCVVLFVGGVAADRIVGFSELGEKDNFSTASLEKRLMQSGVIVENKPKGEVVRPSVRKGFGMEELGSDDESSDFDD
ncbi:hypothetical protein BSKO_00706 [Bryopsis sp. KO-2023]|nr:hypothetical protein BSKO_00706 [Bryopsis sp. KO-2023]